jgi:hypothetical protein
MTPEKSKEENEPIYLWFDPGFDPVFAAFASGFWRREGKGP